MVANGPPAQPLDLFRVTLLPLRKIGGATLLHKAVMHGRIDLLAMLIERGADVNVRDDAYQGSPLDWSLYLDRHRTTPADETVDFLGVAALLRQHGGVEYFPHELDVRLALQGYGRRVEDTAPAGAEYSRSTM